MKIGILGTGQVGTSLAGKLKTLGHDVVLGSRQPGGDKDGVPLLSQADAASHAEWVIAALPGERMLETLTDLDLAGKILIDISNYDASADGAIPEPLGQVIQRAHPNVRVVKALCNVSAHLMADPQSLGASHTVFIAGDDQIAKRDVTDLLASFGWQDIIDLGDLGAARAMEQLVPLWMRLEAHFGGPDFNLSVVRREKA